MAAYIPPFAVVVVLAFLGTALLLGALGVAFAIGIVAHKPRWARRGLRGALTIVLVYGGFLLGNSLFSRDLVLERGEKKYFCEVDCHIANLVDWVEVDSEVGAPPEVLRAAGRFYVIALRTWFDPATTSPQRGDAPLAPNPRVAYVQDAAGRRYFRSADAESALAASGRRSTPLTHPLRPGESYFTLLAFDLPADVDEPRLFVGTDSSVDRLLIGHEMSPLHKRVYFSMR
jgi:hypothetical protein